MIKHKFWFSFISTFLFILVLAYQNCDGTPNRVISKNQSSVKGGIGSPLSPTDTKVEKQDHGKSVEKLISGLPTILEVDCNLAWEQFIKNKEVGQFRTYRMKSLSQIEGEKPHSFQYETEDTITVVEITENHMTENTVTKYDKTLLEQLLASQPEYQDKLKVNEDVGQPYESTVISHKTKANVKTACESGQNSMVVTGTTFMNSSDGIGGIEILEQKLDTVTVQAGTFMAQYLKTRHVVTGENGSEGTYLSETWQNEKYGIVKTITQAIKTEKASSGDLIQSSQEIVTELIEVNY